jgi:anion-transporting  ArsA/GET3 family ATPase
MTSGSNRDDPGESGEAAEAETGADRPETDGTQSPSGRRDLPASIGELVESARILICAGSGGVGKTTAAAVLAMEAARRGRGAVVVTIDPARRLADALGLDELGNEPGTIDGNWDGELSAMMLDTKTTFDELVAKYAADDDQVQRILDNRFYRNISSALSATQEFMAMEKLYELHEEGDFDLIVIDTPPTRNALDFLDAPGTLTRFLDHPLYRVLMAPTRGFVKAVNFAAQALLRTASRVVGSAVIEDVLGFFQAFEGMEDGFRNRAAKVDELLDAYGTHFLLVASPRRDTIVEAAFFAEQLSGAEVTISALVVNRMHPHFGSGDPSEARRRAEELGGTDLGGLYANLADFDLVARREEEHLIDLAERVEPAPVVRVPFLRSDVHDLEGLEELAAHMVPADDPS